MVMGVNGGAPPYISRISDGDGNGNKIEYLHIRIVNVTFCQIYSLNIFSYWLLVVLGRYSRQHHYHYHH